MHVYTVLFQQQHKLAWLKTTSSTSMMFVATRRVLGRLLPDVHCCCEHQSSVLMFSIRHVSTASTAQLETLDVNDVFLKILTNHFNVGLDFYRK